jgi:hypothetical protein
VQSSSNGFSISDFLKMKSLKVISFLLQFLSVLTFAFLGTSCSSDWTLAGTWEYTELKRTKSPSGETEVVIVEGSAGATTSTVTLVYLLEPGSAVPSHKKRSEIFTADHVKNLDVSWQGAGTLDIAYDKARIFDFSNFWRHPTGKLVEIRLRPSNPETSLSAQDKI